MLAIVVQTVHTSPFLRLPIGRRQFYGGVSMLAASVFDNVPSDDVSHNPVQAVVLSFAPN